ncbi:hypothetical protein RvY_19098 [Ramazzottius varieornatus]|uniref:Very long-chain fatty acid transport protein n=1 Tax=Ramazzottius varieornatus TaxID=947166 RepID=A0A1D1W890_RAMVA|nr:hypothetical protein RvY_19098 [Ramazzottius varieornatus]
MMDKSVIFLGYVLPVCSVVFLLGGHYILFLLLVLPFALWYYPSVFPGVVGRFARREYRAALGSAQVVLYTFLRGKENLSAATIFERRLKKHGDKVIFRYGDARWTAQQVDDYANRVANHFLNAEKLEKGDCVALVATSCPQYIAMWLGLNKIGVIAALININVKDEALKHAITTAKAKVVIVGLDLLVNYLPIQSALPTVQRTLLFCEDRDLTNTKTDLSCLDELLKEQPPTKPEVRRAVGYYDTVYYIYTSGTTGLPKPCLISTHRLYTYAISHHYIIRIRGDDVLYCTLPLYHSAGGLIAIGQALFFGTTVVLRKSFSASRFWEDIRQYQCTVFHYVGELCRYLLAQPPSPMDKGHSLRLIYGVGLRPQIWTEFVERFGIRMVAECYGSTEGNVGMVNFDGKPGAIGFSSKWVEYVKQQYVIRVDRETNEPIRNDRGLCILCKANEPGELIGRISNNKFSQFDGYLQKDATQKKKLQNVFEIGDVFFRTGDILVKDEEDYVFFVDRTGDTFRWKGENVSTTEVEGTISRLTHDVDVAAFGVDVPGCEGKAGMACIACLDSDVDMKKLSDDIKQGLAAFARPLFLRFLGAQLEVTGTFKIMKVRLREAAYDLDKVGQDHLYYWEATTSSYQPLTNDIFHRIQTGAIRF